MRIRVLGLVEAVIAFTALYAAVLYPIQYADQSVAAPGEGVGPLLPRGIVFAAIIVMSLLAFGLYSGRQRKQFAGFYLFPFRLIAALVVASAMLTALQYAIPSLHVWQGVSALAVILTGCGVLVSRAAQSLGRTVNTARR